jgi:tetratricopeptide (TPR) repeat protein
MGHLKDINSQNEVLNSARKFARSGNYSEALNLYAQLLPQQSFHTGFLQEYADIAHVAKNYELAIQLIEAALKIEPLNDELLCKLGDIHIERQNFAPAADALRKAYEISPKAPTGLNLAKSLYKLNKFDEAVSLAEAILPTTDDEEIINELYFLQGTVLVDKNLISDGLEFFRKCFQTKARSYVAFRAYSQAKKIDESDIELVTRFESYADSYNLKEIMVEDLFFGLGKAFDDLKDYEKSARYYKKANSLYADDNKFDRSEMIRLMDYLKVCTPELIQSLSQNGFPSKRPIFVVGMPRSGTSLVEQILSSHSQVYGAGELNFIAAITDLVYRLVIPLGKSFPLCLGEFKSTQLSGAGKKYIELIEIINNTAPHVVDKMPQNIMHAGFLKIILPQAKIIHCVRKPHDIALSIFTNKFNAAGMNFSYSFEDILWYLEQYFKIVELWRKVIPEDFYEVKYSEMVENTEETVKKLIEHCDLGWEDSCLEFYKKDRLVKTVSKVQVRQPIYKTSKEKWKNYENYFGDFFTKISQLADKYNYLDI